MATTERHGQISAQFLEQAEAELRNGDLLQASEKAWGAVTHYVNSLAREYGWPMGGHNDVRANARKVMRLTDDPEQSHVRFTLAEGLHGNFYHEFSDAEAVALALRNTRILLSDMQAVELDSHFGQAGAARNPCPSSWQPPLPSRVPSWERGG